MTYSGEWMEVEIMMLSKINQTQKDKLHVFSHIWNIDLKEKYTKVEGKLLGIGKGIRGR
jgi:hypothetical protein